MAKFKFVGDGKETIKKDHKATAFGYTFIGAKPTEVFEEAAVKKLFNNSHFQEVPEKKKAQRKKVTKNGKN